MSGRHLVWIYDLAGEQVGAVRSGLVELGDSDVPGKAGGSGVVKVRYTI